jgi:hypothetical protein
LAFFFRGLFFARRGERRHALVPELNGKPGRVRDRLSLPSRQLGGVPLVPPHVDRQPDEDPGSPLFASQTSDRPEEGRPIRRPKYSPRMSQ